MDTEDKIGFTTFCTEDWLPLMKVLVDSVRTFSKYPITINCLNFDYDFKDPLVTSRRLDLPISFYGICKAKIISSVESDYDVSLVLDADMVVTKDVDKIFNENLKVKDLDFPLFAKHPHNPFTNPNHCYVMPTVKIFTDKMPKMKYVYASYLFGNKNKWFLKEVLTEMEKHDGLTGADEIVINALLTKYEVDFDIGYNFLPNSTLIDCYLNKDFQNKELYETYLKYDCLVKFFIFHGCKDSNVARSILERLKNE